MTLTLEITGEEVQNGPNLTNLILDDKAQLGLDSEALMLIIGKVVKAINVMGQQVEKLREDDDQLHDAVQHLEQQISSFEVRSRECEDTCQEIRLQLGTMVMESQKSPDHEANKVEAARSEVSRKDLNEVIQKLDVLTHEVQVTKSRQESDMAAQDRKVTDLESSIERHQDFFDDDLEVRLVQMDEERQGNKGELEVLREGLAETNNRKASKVELGDVAHQVHSLDEGQRANYRMLTEAQAQFAKLDGLTDLVNENQSRMQEMWGMMGKEWQELREWASGGFSELRSVVRTKMSEQEATAHVAEIRKEVRELAPFLSEAMSRVEMHVRQKAEHSDVQRLSDDMEVLNRASGRPKQLLLGTKCLACDREVSSADATDLGPISLVDRRQTDELWNEVQRALDKKTDFRQPHGSPKDVLKYVAIHVGNPTNTSSLAGTGMYDGRDANESAKGGHALVRTGVSHAQTHSGGFHRAHGADANERMQPRDNVPLVRVAPRRPGRYSGAIPNSPATPRDNGGGRRGPPSSSMRAAMGIATGMPAGGSPSTAAASPPLAAHSSLSMMSEAAYSPVRLQPSAHSGMGQPSATEYDPEPYVIEGGRSDSPLGQDGFG